MFFLFEFENGCSFVLERLTCFGNKHPVAVVIE